MSELSLREARRVALAAQGLADRRPGGRIDVRHMRRVIKRLGAIQIDSVNVVDRAHYLTLFARLGPYPRAVADRAAFETRDWLEYWFHQASYGDMDLFPAMRSRMAAIRPWPRVQSMLDDHPGYLELVYQEVVDRGPLSADQLSDPGKRSGPWWGLGKGKTALEYLYATGRLAVSRRTRTFKVVYDTVERVVPRRLLDTPHPTPEEAYRRRLQVAARALGVATAADLADYFRMRVRDTEPRLEELADEGVLHRVRVEGWRRPAYLHRDARLPRRVDARALLAPFDSLVWDRQRTERLFGFHYRIEIYTPAPQRRFGYYVLPFLLGEELVARVDLKADRRAGVLRVRGSYREPDRRSTNVAGPLAEELRLMAAWLGLNGVSVANRGDLAGAVRAALG